MIEKNDVLVVTNSLITFYTEMLIKQNKITNPEKLVKALINEIMNDIYIENINIQTIILEQHNRNLLEHKVDLSKYLKS